MPLTMIKRRVEILKWLSRTNNISLIARETGFNRTLIRDVKNSLEQDQDVFTLKKKLGTKVKVSEDIKNEVVNLTIANRRMAAKSISDIINQNPQLNSISASTVYRIKHEMKFNYLPPIHTFFTTQEQRTRRVHFAQKHLNLGTDWSNVLFTDESSFELDSSHRWVWKRRGENSPDVQHCTKKFNRKVMVFGGISRRYTTALIAIKGSIFTESYIDECIDDSGLIVGMNEIYGPFKWVLMQDGATPHTSQITLDYLNDYCNVLNDWPSGSPDMNPIENLWSILKRDVDVLNPQNEDQLIDLLFNSWETLDVSLIHNLIDSVPSRLQAVIDSSGYPTKY